MILFPKLFPKPHQKRIFWWIFIQKSKEKHDFYTFFLHNCRVLVGRGGFEPPKSKTSDLQSDPFGRSGICPFMKLLEPVIGLEPTTCWLQISCSANWATPAGVHHYGGALGRNWTTDRQIFSLLLYQLSYQGIRGDPERARTVDLQRDRLAL